MAWLGTDKKFEPYTPGQIIRFTKSSKYDYDFQKNDIGFIQKVLSPYPRATDTIYLVVHDVSNEIMWVTGKDVEMFDQLSLDYERCKEISYRHEQCELKRGHGSFHKADTVSWSSGYASS